MTEYNYQCKNCGENFSVFVKMGTIIIEKLRCPNCGSGHIRRIWQPVAIHYKGNGFTKGSGK